jgi:uncharacterized protein YyaL (SSP411 family)
MNPGRKPNRLIQEKSPYLQQHAYNPVEWHPWGPEAFQKARDLDRPILLSIGYATCHWCHVMERESFEDESIARFLSEHFVAVKVDREERPDVDQIYMKALHGMGQQGGWPLNMFLTPELEPFTGGTYFPPEPAYGRASFRQVLQTIANLWQNDRAKISQSAEAVTEFLKQQSPPSDAEIPGPAAYDAALAYFLRSYDARHGGFAGNGPNKFPPSMSILFLLRRYERTGEKHLLAMVEHTLDAMRRGGIYDQIGGGLSRYSTDHQWLVPHFEKMLYDNALFMRALCETYRITRNERYKLWASDVLDYLNRDLSSPEGAFYSAEDADSEGEEGKFYVWSSGELRDVLAAGSLSAEEIENAVRFFGVTDRGNFEGSNILFEASSRDAFLKTAGLDAAVWNSTLTRARSILLAHRSRRERPLRDDKIITSWNALAVWALARMAFVFDDAAIGERARKAMRFLDENLQISTGLLRRHHSGESRFHGGLQDYATYGLAALDLYRLTFDDSYMKAATQAGRWIQEKFARPDGGYFDTEAGQDDLIVRAADVYDGVEPSGNSAAALLFTQLSGYGFQEFRGCAEGIMRAFGSVIREQGPGCTILLLALDSLHHPMPEIVISGDTSAEEETFLRSISTLPAEIPLARTPGRAPLLEGKADSGKSAFYICRNQACEAPQHSASRAAVLVTEALALKRN